MVLGVEHPLTPSTAARGPLTPNTPLTPATLSTATAKGKTKMPKIGKEKHRAYSLDMDAGNNILGIVMLEIERAEDLPRLKNMTRTSFDMDPFAVISFGKKVFRVRRAVWKAGEVNIYLLLPLQEEADAFAHVARRLLKSLSIKQGNKYDAPQCAVDIRGFIEFHGLEMDEILEPLPSRTASPRT
ncbi:hypothetical protein C0991_010087, partial [Blastosporella zonata]